MVAQVVVEVESVPEAREVEWAAALLHYVDEELLYLALTSGTERAGAKCEFWIEDPLLQAATSLLPESSRLYDRGPWLGTHQPPLTPDQFDGGDGRSGVHAGVTR